jgi:hypothetical protein
MIREKLIAFFRAEIDAEEQWGFPRLNRLAVRSSLDGGL